MNPELKQRLIGAAVVTALATIFIPMLFDDPVDNIGKSVTELTIPPVPIKSDETSTNKLTTPANKAIKKPNATAEAPSDTEDDPAEPVVEGEMVDDAEAEASAEPRTDGTTPPQAAVETEQATNEADGESLDTGVVAEAKPPVKKSAKSVVEPDVEVKIKQPLKKTETNAPKLLPSTKPVAAVKAPVKKAENTPAAATTKPPSADAEKPAKTEELVRWTIHAGSFGQKDNATTLMKTLREQGIPVSIETISSAKGPMYRLKIGPELDKKKAAANKAKLDKQGVGNVMIAE
ncbi:MAG: SPOR domain-containing protein [Methylococcales bacterium]|nr:SPOR domain-containing protein [Methylococcales bacterium]